MLAVSIESRPRLYPWFPDIEQLINRLPEMQCSNRDIFIFAYPKCGTHWVNELVHMLLNDTHTLSELPKESAMLEALEPDQLDFNTGHCRVFNSHLCPDALPDSLFKNGSKVIFLLRNPKDTAISYYHHVKGMLDYNYSGNLDGFLDLFLSGNIEYGSYFDYIKQWMDKFHSMPEFSPNYIEIHYEDLKLDFEKTLMRLAEFLQVNSSITDGKQVKKIQHASSFENMQKYKVQDSPTEAVTWKDDYKSFGFYRKGVIGDWRNEFLKDEVLLQYSEQFDQAIEIHFADNYPTLAEYCRQFSKI